MKKKLLLSLCSFIFIAAPVVSKADDSVAQAKTEQKTETQDQVSPSVLKRFDKNKDGKLDAEETAAYEAEKAKRREKYAEKRQEELTKYDANKDGVLDKEERAKMKADKMAEKAKKDSE